VWVSVIGERIREKREMLGISQAALADRLGKCPSAVAKWEQGVNNPKSLEVAKLAKTLRCSLGWLLGGGA